jgi:CheY-like chemotaxis protein
MYAPTGSAPISGRGRVLVVDDEYPIRRLLAGYLEAAGLTVIEANDGE